MSAPVTVWSEIDTELKEQIGEFRKIHSGIHIGLLGTTRGGKTTLATGGKTGRGILRHFEDCLVIDSTGDPGYISSYGKPFSRYRRIEGHRRLSVSNMSPKSRESIYKAIQKAHSQGNVAIYIDELRQITDKKYFNLGPLMDYLWLFTAKRGISVIGGSQAPRWLPSAFYDQSKIHFLFGNRDKRAMKRIAEIGGDTETLESVLPNLDRWQFAMVGLDGSVKVSKFEMPKSASNEKPTEKRLLIHPS